MPETSLKNVVSYESYIAEADGDFAWADFDERTAAGMCLHVRHHGRPKRRAVFRTGRIVLHAMAAIQPDMLNLSSREPVDAGGSIVSRQ